MQFSGNLSAGLKINDLIALGRKSKEVLILTHGLYRILNFGNDLGGHACRTADNDTVSSDFSDFGMTQLADSGAVGMGRFVALRLKRADRQNRAGGKLGGKSSGLNDTEVNVAGEKSQSGFARRGIGNLNRLVAAVECVQEAKRNKELPGTSGAAGEIQFTWMGLNKALS